MFKLICTFLSVRNWEEETGDRYIERLSNSKLVLYTRCHVIAFISYMFDYYEIIKILILITSFCAPSDVLVYVFAVFPVFFFSRVSEIQLRSAVEDIQKPSPLRTRSLLVLLYFVCLNFFFRLTPAFALTLVVYKNVIHFHLPNR